MSVAMHVCRAVATSSAGPVLAGQFFLKVKNKTPFYKKQVINKSARVIFSLSIGLL